MTVATDPFARALSQDKLAALFPRSRADEFFEALFGDAAEGAYDISLAYRETRGDQLILDLLLHQRPNRCLACNLTQGLPQVFSRHPIINIKGLVAEVDGLLGDEIRCTDWSLGRTEQANSALHLIPLKITFERC
jgi:hypothetical protein